MKLKVYIIILNYNGYDDTVECLSSVLDLKFDRLNVDYKIIVVDNSENDEDFEKFKENFKDADFLHENSYQKSGKKVVFIKSLQNRGYSAGNNIGIKYAFFNGGFDFMWILNNDTVVEKKSLECLLLKFLNLPEKIGFLGNKLLYYKKNIIQAIGGKYNKFIAQSKAVGAFEEDKGQYDKKEIKKIVDFPVGASLCFKREFLEEVGLFNETYFLYFEEMDYVIRAKNMGWDFDVCMDCIVWHKEGRSTGKNLTRNERTDYINLKNRIIFTKRYFPCYLPFVYLSFVPVIINRFKRKRFFLIVKIFKLLMGKS